MQKIKIILILTQYLSIQNLSTHAIRPKLYENYAFSQNFHTRELGEITVCHAVITVYCS